METERIRKTMIRQPVRLSSKRLGWPMHWTRKERGSTPALQRMLVELQRMAVELKMIPLV
jgi:hypothetical protein